MKRAALIGIVFFFGLATHAQAQNTPNWDWYRLSSPLFRAVTEQLEKDGVRLSYDKADIQNFGNLFVTATIPVAIDQGRVPATSGTLGILIVFVKTPGMSNWPIAEIVRLYYYGANLRTRATTIEGRVSDLSKDGSALFGDKMLVLTIDPEGRIKEELNQLILERAGWKLRQDCIEIAIKTVAERCRQENYLDWVGCRFSGWLWVKQKCSEYMTK